MLTANALDFNFNALSYDIRLWGYPLMFFLMTIEGPITTITSAFLASQGYFSLMVVFVLSMLGDIIGDIVMYSIGYWGGRPTFAKVEKLFKIKEHFVQRLEEGFRKNGSKIIFYVKTTPGISWAAFILAGSLKMPFKKFLFFSLLGGIVWSGAMVGLGYFFGYAAIRISQHLRHTSFIILISFILVGVLFRLVRKYF